MTGRFVRRGLAIFAIGLAGIVSIGGGGTYVMMEVTTKPSFCRTCHNMETYVDSWAKSSHNMVTCVDCHYEPGLLETFEGKFKALSQLAKYVTQTAGTKLIEFSPSEEHEETRAVVMKNYEQMQEQL